MERESIVVFVKRYSTDGSSTVTRHQVLADSLSSLKHSIAIAHHTSAARQRIYWDFQRQRPVSSGTAPFFRHGDYLHCFDDGDDAATGAGTGVQGANRQGTSQGGNELRGQNGHAEDRRSEERAVAGWNVDARTILPYSYGAVPASAVIHDDEREHMMRRSLIFAWGLRIVAIIDGICLVATVLIHPPSPERTVLASVIGGPIVGYIAIAQFAPVLLLAYVIYHGVCILTGVWLGIIITRIYWEVLPLLLHAWIVNLVVRFTLVVQSHSREEQVALRRHFFSWPLFLLNRR